MTAVPKPFFRRTWSEHPLWHGLGAGSGIVALLIIYLPVLWLAVMSFSAEPLSGFPGPFTTRWYDQLAGNSNWSKPLGLSFAVAALVAILCMMCAGLVGRAIPRLRRGRNAVVALTLLPLMVPGVVVGTALFLYFRVLLGLKLGFWSLVVGHFVWSFPFALLAVLVVALRFDNRLLEVGADLGAGRLRRFFDIELPLLKDGIVAGGLFAFLLSFNEIARSIYLRGREETLPVYLWQQASAHSSNVPLIYALNVIILVVSAIVVGVAFRLLFARRR
jgi:putative spermidine/putrescine transport system permease protein/spermidine/putrescine transport system permease protein